MIVSRLRLALRHPISAIRFVARQYILNNYIDRAVFRKNSSEILSVGISFASTNEQIVNTANNILKGELNLYGDIRLQTGSKINWHRDYLSAHIWPGDIRITKLIIEPIKGADIKTPWEISRCHHLVAVAQAYKLTKKLVYADYVQAQIRDWIKDNPVGYGVNWKNPMEIAIRACNWLVAFDLIRGSGREKDNDFDQVFSNSLDHHSQLIRLNLENLSIKTNHYIADLAGMFWINLLCPKLPGSSYDLKFAKTNLEKEIARQFYPDGVSKEASTNYHRLVLEMIGQTIRLGERHGVKFSSDSLSILNKAFTFSLNYETNGPEPQFGDNDSGRFLILDDYGLQSCLEHNHLIDLFEKLFPNIRPTSFPSWYEHGRIAIKRSGPWRLLVNLSPLGQYGCGGHNHDDLGSFVLDYCGQQIIVDPGCYSYTGKGRERNFFRSALAHNAPVCAPLVNEPPAETFQVNNFTRLRSVSNKDDSISFEGVARSYSFTRVLTLNGGLDVQDNLFDPDKQIIVTLTLHPKARAVLIAGTAVIDDIIKITASEGELVLDETEYSPSYCKKIKTQKIVIRGLGCVSFRVSLLK